MSRSLHTWYSLPDLDRFAERQTVIEGAVALNRLSRLRDLLNTDTGSVNARLRFTRRGTGSVGFELTYEASLELICQRCLEPFRFDVAAQVEMSLMESASAEATTPQEYEPVFLEGDRFNPAELVEDELIVSLPLAPRHETRSECGRLAGQIEELSCEAAQTPSSGTASGSH